MEIKKKSKFLQGCVLRRKIEGSPVLVNCKIWGAQHMICMKKLRFPSPSKAKVRCLLHIYVIYITYLVSSDRGHQPQLAHSPELKIKARKLTLNKLLI